MPRDSSQPQEFRLEDGYGEKVANWCTLNVIYIDIRVLCMQLRLGCNVSVIPKVVLFLIKIFKVFS